jgi:hypothetical protein
MIHAMFNFSVNTGTLKVSFLETPNFIRITLQNVLQLMIK